MSNNENDPQVAGAEEPSISPERAQENARETSHGDDGRIPAPSGSVDINVMTTFLNNLKIMNDRLSNMSHNTGGSGGRCVAVGAESVGAVKVQAPKNFTVGQNFRIWLERFDSFADLTRIPEAQRRPQLLSRLDSPAYVAVSNLHLPETMGYGQFCAALGRRFNNTSREDFKLQLRSRVQLSQETNEAFADSLQELALNAYPDSGHPLQEEMALDQFLSGVTLDESLRQQLFISAPKTLDEAVRKVRQLNAAKLVCQRAPSHDSKPRVKVASATTTSSKPEGVSDMTKVLDLLGKMDARLSQLEQTRGHERGQKCWRCHSEGHTHTSCPTIECYQCHQKGHMARDCAHQQGNYRQGASKGGPASRRH